MPAISAAVSNRLIICLPADQTCRGLGDYIVMDRKPNYIIPAGTKVEIQSLKQGSELRQHITQKELRFADRTNTGYDGRVFYFTFCGWSIAVNADLVK